MEALLGTLLSSGDPRARSVIADLAGDPLANDILARVEESPFGTRGSAGDVLENRASRIVRTSASTSPAPHPFANPSVEWQAHLKERLKAGAVRAAASSGGSGVEGSTPPRLSLVTDMHRAPHDRDPAGESPRQRRRLDSSSPRIPLIGGVRATPSLSPTSVSPSDEEEDNEELASAVGQLSLNEDSQVRYHGQVSGLHILGQNDRLDKRNEGGIWRFPKAGVWPRAATRHDEREWQAEVGERLPSKEDQHDLLDLYFAYVHPVLPVMQKKQFWRDFRGE